MIEYCLTVLKQITKELTKIRINCHDLLIELGRYFRPKIPRKERKCDICQIVEDEEHFMLFCTKFNDLRSDLFEKLGILRKYQELKSKSHESISLLNKYWIHKMLITWSWLVLLFHLHSCLGSFVKCIVKILYLLGWQIQCLAYGRRTPSYMLVFWNKTFLFLFPVDE